jgi:hypothetical protein
MKLALHLVNLLVLSLVKHEKSSGSIRVTEEVVLVGNTVEVWKCSPFLCAITQAHV